MKKIIALVTILILVTVLICSCTQVPNEIIDGNDSTKTETYENTDEKNSSEEGNPMDSIDKDNIDEQTEDEKDESVNKSPSIINIATVENKTDYSCKVEVKEGDNGKLIATIIINDVNGEELQRLTYQTEFDEQWYNMYVENGGEICRFVDFNFDGYPDVVTQLYGAMVNQWYKVWLYNPTTKQFENSEEYETQVNPKINIDKKLVLSTRYNRGIPSYELSYVENGHLAYQGSIIGEISDDGNVIYVQRMYGYINEDGEIAYREVQSYDVISSVDDLDELWSNFEIKLVQ